MGTPQFINGQLHNQPHRKGRSAPDGFGRLDGAPKRLADPHALTYGADKRVTKPSHQWAHGAPLDDEPMQKTYEGRQVPVHPSMKSRGQRGQEADGFAMLDEAGRLGRPKS